MEISHSEYSELKQNLMKYAHLEDEKFQLEQRLCKITQKQAEIKNQIYVVAICSTAYVQLVGQIAILEGDEEDLKIRFITPIVINSD